MGTLLDAEEGWRRNWLARSRSATGRYLLRQRAGSIT
jgi:hypothetical protein